MPSLVDYSTVTEMFNKVADHYAGQDRTAVRYKDTKDKQWKGISWDELRNRVHALAAYLHKRGIKAGDRVAILSENRPEWAITDLATQHLGGVHVSLYTSLPPSQVKYILKDSGAKIFFVSTGLQVKKAKEVFDECEDLIEVIAMSEFRTDPPEYMRHWDDVMAEGAAAWAEMEGNLKSRPNQVKPEDLCTLIYTSGTTGNPKGVMLTNTNICENVKSAMTMVPFGPDDHHLSFLPLCHSFERTGGYIAVMSAGATITYAESVDAVSRNLGEVHPTVMISVPRLFEKVYNIISKSVEEGSGLKKKIFNWSVASGKKFAGALSDGRTPGPLLKMRKSIAHKLVFSKLHEKLGGRLRFAVSGGAALPQAIGEFFQAAGITIIEGYGLTETSPVLTIAPFHAPRYGTVGHVIDGVTVGIQRISDGEIIGQITGSDYPSDLTTEAGEIVAKGPNIMKGYWNNESATKESIDDAGWYHTGDVGRFQDGYLMITDRIKHMIVSRGGKNIYPGPIEEQFSTVPSIDQMMIIGEGREYLTALVVPNMDVLKVHARDKGIPYQDAGDLLEHDDIKKIFADQFKAYSRKAAAHEKIRDFRLIAEPFTVENGTMTPTMKLKRKVIEKQFAELIEGMYGVFA